MATAKHPEPNHKPEAHAKPVAAEVPTVQAADPNGTANCADKDWFKRKHHGGTGA